MQSECIIGCVHFIHCKSNVYTVLGNFNLVKVGCDADVSRNILPCPSRLMGEDADSVCAQPASTVSECE
jgi:hypothetical protein